MIIVLRRYDGDVFLHSIHLVAMYNSNFLCVGRIYINWDVS